MMAVAALMATTGAYAQFEKGKWSLQPYAGGVVSSITNVGSYDLDDGTELKKKMTVLKTVISQCELWTDNVMDFE